MGAAGRPSAARDGGCCRRVSDASVPLSLSLTMVCCSVTARSASVLSNFQTGREVRVPLQKGQNLQSRYMWNVQADKGLALEDIDAKDGAARGVDTSRHFSYYAFEGKTGVLRWKHEVIRARDSSAPPVDVHIMLS